MVIRMKKKPLPFSAWLAMISAAVALFLVIVVIILNAFFDFASTPLSLLLVFAVLAGGLVLLAGETLVGRPLGKLLSELRSVSLETRPQASFARVKEMRAIYRAVRALWLQSQKLTSCLFSTIETYSTGFFYHLDDEDRVYVNQKFREICDEEGEGGFVPMAEFERMHKKVTALYYHAEYRAYLLEDFRWVRLHTNRHKNFFFGLLYDITGEVNAIKKIERDRDIDPLTGLYNRFAFTNLAANILNDNSIKTAAVVMWDIDKLKGINDTYGHDNGDRYLREFATALKTLEDYGGLIARRSGDEFLALVYGDDREQIEPLIAGINDTIEAMTVSLDNDAVAKMQASYGVAWYPEDGTALEELIKRADAALYKNKQRPNVMNKTS